MEDNGLMYTEVHGGGYLQFCEDGSIEVSGLSYAFKSVIPEEIILYIRQVWPSAKIYTSEVEYLSNADLVHYHRVYSLDEVTLEASKEDQDITKKGTL
jgi:hypothetical protein